MVRALSAGKLSSYREGVQISGVQTSLLAEDEGQKQDLSQKLCCFGRCAHSHLCRLLFSGVPEPRWLPLFLRQKPPGPGGHLSSGRGGGRMSGARKGLCLRSSMAPTCPRSCQLLCAHSHLCRLLFGGVLEPRWLSQILRQRPPGPGGHLAFVFFVVCFNYFIFEIII